MAAEPNVVPVVPVHAGFWRRVAASLLDTLVLLIPSSALGYLIGGHLGLLAETLLWVVYRVAMESSPAQATLGKRWVGIKVTDAQGHRIGVGRALGRALGCVSFPCCPLDSGTSWPASRRSGKRSTTCWLPRWS